MANRPVTFFWLLDCSSSMIENGKISTLNFAVKEAIPEMRRVADDNPTAALMVRTLTFATGARWHRGPATRVADFTWGDVTAGGVTDLGAALRLLAGELRTPPMPYRALPPVLALVSDGQPTDDWRGGLEEVDATPWGQHAVRVAIAVGQDADRAMLQEFLANPEAHPLEANNPRALTAAIRWTSTVAVKVASAARDRPLPGPENPLEPPTLVTSDEDEVW